MKKTYRLLSGVTQSGIALARDRRTKQTFWVYLGQSLARRIQTNGASYARPFRAASEIRRELGA